MFRVNLHTYLKGKINANIYVTINKDTLWVKISKHEFYWQTKYPNILDKIINNISSKELSNKIIKTFRRDVLGTFFY